MRETERERDREGERETERGARAKSEAAILAGRDAGHGQARQGRPPPQPAGAPRARRHTQTLLPAPVPCRSESISVSNTQCILPLRRLTRLGHPAGRRRLLRRARGACPHTLAAPAPCLAGPADRPARCPWPMQPAPRHQALRFYLLGQKESEHALDHIESGGQG